MEGLARVWITILRDIKQITTSVLITTREGKGEIPTISPFAGTYPRAGATIGESIVGVVPDPIHVPVVGPTIHDETVPFYKQKMLKIGPLPHTRTPVKAKTLESMLISSEYDRLETQFLVDGFTFGFRLNCSVTPLPGSCQNLQSARLHKRSCSKQIRKRN